MFFPEPDRAFAHIRQSLVNGGRFGVVCSAGFADVVVEPGPSSGDLGSADDLEGAARRAIEQNPGIAPGFAAASQPDRAAAVAAATETMSRHIVAGRVVMGAATWVVTARVS